MKLVNLTPHSIVLQGPDGDRIVVPPAGQLARVASQPGTRLDEAGDYEGAPCPLYGAPNWGAVEGLPAYEPGTILIVSALVAGQSRRYDVFSPGTGPNDGAIREPDELPVGYPNPRKGQIVAVTRLIRAG